MRERKADLGTFVCGFAFLFGGGAGCLICLLCSESAFSWLQQYIHRSQLFDSPGICIAAELLFAVFALLLSTAAFGMLIIPALDSALGYCCGIQFCCVASAADGFCGFNCGIVFVSAAVLILLHISSVCFGLSSLLLSRICGIGTKTCDLRCRLFHVWVDLVILLILFALHGIFRMVFVM